MGPTFSHGDLKEMICERLSFSQLKSSQLKSTSQVYTETTDNHTEAYRMCSGSQQDLT
jgi:hypothetical protein